MIWGYAGVLLGVSSKLHSGTCRFFTSTRPPSPLQLLRGSPHGSLNSSHSIKAPNACHLRHLAVQASRNEHSSAISTGGQGHSKLSAHSIRSAISAAAASDRGSAHDAGLLSDVGRRVLSTLTAAAFALVILFSSTPTAYAAGFPFTAPRLSSTPATMEMKVTSVPNSGSRTEKDSCCKDTCCTGMCIIYSNNHDCR